MQNESKYKTEYWQGREVLPGESMRFVNNRNIPAPMRMDTPKLGGDIAPLFDRNKAGHRIKPRRPRTTPESYTVADAIVGKVGDKRAFGKFLDTLNRRTK